MRLLYSWRAHAQSICHVEYLVGIEGIITASADCTVRLWTLSGEQVGIFGQGDPWRLDERDTWFDDVCHTIEGTHDDKVVASERRLQALLPPPLKMTKPDGPAAAGTVDSTKDVYRLPGSQLEELQRLGKLLNLKPVRQQEVRPSAHEVISSLPPVKMLDGSSRPQMLKRQATLSALQTGQATTPAAKTTSNKSALWQPSVRTPMATRDMQRQLFLSRPGSSPNLWAASRKIAGDASLEAGRRAERESRRRAPFA